MSPPLLATKLYCPHVPAALVDRPRLFARLDQGLSQAARLILVSAPAGFGKSTLVSAWLGTLAPPAVWLSLDAQDNDPLRFLTYLTAALQRALPGFGPDLLPQLRGGAPDRDQFLATLLNALAQAPTPLPMVLDDYHAITNPALHESLSVFLERLPPGVTLVLATRVAPPLPVARLRAQRQLVDIRLQDLRFTREEAARLINDLHRLNLDAQAIATLEARTEGWAAGLQLAALALEATPDDHQAFLAQFSGSHEFIADYLVEEVLSHQPPAVTNFLLRISVLDRFCAPLCAAVAGATESESLLEDLLARNIFLIPLDAERRWFRYHHLFADLLRARLKRSQPALLPELHRRASAWLEAEGLIDEAISHALAAGDDGAAARMADQHCVTLIHQGQIGTILRWVAALPAAVRETYPGLSTAQAWALFLRGQTDDVAPHLQQAERVLERLRQEGQLPEASAGYRHLYAGNEVLRAFLLYARRDLEGAYAQAQRALPFSRQAGDMLEGGLKIITGHICRELGRPAEAAQHYRDGIPLAWEGGNTVGVLNAYTALSRIYRQSGQPQPAEQACQEALGLLRERGLERLPAAGMLYLEQATLLLEQGRPAESRAVIDTALDVVRTSGMADLLAACEALRARIIVPSAQASSPGLPDPLTPRELEVLALLATGLSNQEIAEKLALSLATVKKHTSSILAKLDATSRTHAVARARQLGLV